MKRNRKSVSAACAPSNLRAGSALHEWKKSLRHNYDLYLLLIPVILWYGIFCYAPMYGLKMAFMNYNPAAGFAGSKWVWFKHLERFVNSVYFKRVLVNTLTVSLLSLAISIPAPLILALLFEEIRSKRTKTVCQTISYAPNFISVVVLCSMITMFLTPETGFLDKVVRFFGYKGDNIMGDPKMFKWVYVLSGVWQCTGWGSVIYSAAIAGVNQELYEAARLDGASRLKQIWYITIPAIRPTIIILAIMAIGGVMSVGYEKVYLLQNDMNMIQSEVISTYVYKAGLKNAQYSFGTMVGLFNNVINFIILALANGISRRVSSTSLW